MYYGSCVILVLRIMYIVVIGCTFVWKNLSLKKETTMLSISTRVYARIIKSVLLSTKNVIRLV